uniref:Glucose-induced degradation protein 8 homolog isoform X2 n=1 Tax=Rhizophora mucronata TaxID=61149 RepID=A0A2P2LFU4_RHIMU
MAALTSLAVFSRCEISRSSPTGQLETSSKASSATVLSKSFKKLCCRNFQHYQTCVYHQRYRVSYCKSLRLTPALRQSPPQSWVIHDH